MINETFHLFSAGALTFAIKRFVGDRLEEQIANRMSQRRATIAVGLVYFFGFFYIWHWFDARKRLEINHLINAREFNGEVMSTIVA